MTDVADPKYVTVDSVAQDPDDAQYESFMSQLSVEPDDNEQANKNPFFDADFNRTGSIESVNALAA